MPSIDKNKSAWINVRTATAAIAIAFASACAPIDDAEDADQAIPEETSAPDVSESGSIDKGGIFTLGVSKNGSGTITGINTNGGATVINCGSDCSEGFIWDSFVALTATAASGSRFTGWSGACTGTAPSCTVRVGFEGADAVANFVADAPTATISMTVWGQNGPGYLRAIPNGDVNRQVYCGVVKGETKTCQAVFPIGTSVAVNTKPGVFTSNTCPTSVVGAPPNQGCNFTLAGNIAFSSRIYIGPRF